jgi:hypothetical protein
MWPQKPEEAQGQQERGYCPSHRRKGLLPSVDSLHMVPTGDGGVELVSVSISK